MTFKKEEKKERPADMNNVEVTGEIFKVFCNTKKYSKFILKIVKDKGFVNVLCHYFGDMKISEGDSIHIGGEIDTIKSEYNGNTSYASAIRITEYE